MGSSCSKARGSDAETSQPIPYQISSFRISRVPAQVQVPDYPIEHNTSCQVLRQWELDGEASRNYRYIVYVNNNNLLNKRQKHTQDLILEIIQQYAAIHEVDVWVKCLDYISDEGSDPDAEREKQFYKDMLATESKSELIQMWEQHAHNILSLPGVNVEDQPLKPIEQEIDNVIEMIRNSKGLDDSDAKSQIEPVLVAALSKFNRGWPLDKFLPNQTQIFGKTSDIEAGGISKLQAQFHLQTRAAYASLAATEGSVPTIAVHILPERISSSTLDNIRKYIAATRIPLSKLVGQAGKAVRQDRYMMQLISLGTARGNGGHQWQNLDDEKSGGMDIIDHMPVDIDQLLEKGPGPFFGLKLMLGSVDPDMDRSKKGKNVALYGKKSTRLTKEEMERCDCQKQPIIAETVTPSIQPAQEAQEQTFISKE